MQEISCALFLASSIQYNLKEVMRFEIDRYDYVRRKFYLSLTRNEGERLLCAGATSTSRSPWKLAHEKDSLFVVHKDKDLVIAHFGLKIEPFGFSSKYVFIHKSVILKDAYLNLNELRYFITYDLLGRFEETPCLVTSNNFRSVSSIEAEISQGRLMVGLFWISGFALKHERRGYLWKDLSHIISGLPIVPLEEKSLHQDSIFREKIRTQSVFRALVEPKFAGPDSLLSLWYVE